MFEQYFGFTSTPFSKGIGAGNMFISSSFRELQMRFDFVKANRGIMVLTGESGVGKTCAIRYFLNSLSNNYICVYLPLATVGVSDFYRYLNSGLNGDKAFFKSDVFKSIQDRIFDYTTNKNMIPVIIFDEAHLLKESNISELQLITNFKTDSFDPAIFILTGQPVLLDRLSKNVLNSFYQRITLKYRLESFTREETEAYILHQLKLSSCTEKILTDNAFDNIFKLSKGSLRIIGAIVTKALIMASIEKKRIIDGDDIAKVSLEVL